MARIETHPIGTFAWHDLITPDIDASRHFYGGLFGWETVLQESPGGPYAFFELGGLPVTGVGEMNADMQESGTPPTWNAYVGVETLESALDRVVSAGGSVVFGPQEIPGQGRLAYFQDPEGAVLALWQSRRDSDATRTGEAGTVCWTELASRDIDSAARFYTGVFGWEAVANPNGAPSDYRVFRNSGADIGGALRMDAQWGDAPAHWSVYFQVDDCAASARRVTGLGGSIRQGPFDSPVGPIAVCSDNVGTHFYLLQLRQAESARD